MDGVTGKGLNQDQQLDTTTWNFEFKAIHSSAALEHNLLLVSNQVSIFLQENTTKWNKKFVAECR